MGPPWQYNNHIYQITDEYSDVNDCSWKTGPDIPIISYPVDVLEEIDLHEIHYSRKKTVHVDR